MLKIKCFLILVVIGLNFNLSAQIVTSDWELDEAEITTALQMADRAELNAQHSNWRICQISTQHFLSKLRSEKQEILVPTPDGLFETFEIYPVQVVADEVAHLYTIKTFRGHKKGQPSVVMSCDISPNGFHAAVYNGKDSYYVEPVQSTKPDQLLVFFGKDNILERPQCHVQSEGNNNKPSDSGMEDFKAPEVKRIYRLALVAGGEYSQQFGGYPFDETDVLNSLASGVNTVNPIYSRDLGVEFSLVTTGDLIFQNPQTDPFNTSDIYSMVEEVHNQCNLAIGNDSFDIGHLVLWSNTGGYAMHASVGEDASKGAAFSGSSASSKTLWIDYVCHELGHQFGAEHNFAAHCSGNSVDNFRFEPGEGSSIMAYANACGGSSQFQGECDPFFHYSSIEEMQYTLSLISASETVEGNSSDPIVDAKNNITIPKETPFVLVGEGSDGNDPLEALTYDWEQFNGDGPVASGYPNCGSSNSPLFRYRSPVSDNFRSFPVYGDVLAGKNGTTWEKLPCVARDMLFSLAVRDNNPIFGRVAHETMTVTVAETGPFVVTAPNGGESYSNNTTVSWTVNGTDSHCPLVDVLLSLDGGSTYTVLADAVENDGSHSIDFPEVSTSARVLVRCDVDGEFRASSIFYDVSDANFSISQVATGYRVHPIVFLEGAYLGASQMSTGLTDQIPANQPYNVEPYNYMGTESLEFVSPDMVDWILLEVRSGTPNTVGARNTVNVETRAGILLKDGSVVDVNGDPVVFKNLNADSPYRLCIRHRNHLDVLFAVEVEAAANMYFDFTIDGAVAFGQEQLKMHDDGTAMMHAGDFNQDAVIQNTDFDKWQSEPAVINAYASPDGNLDGVIQTTDFDLWNLNKAKIGHPELEF